MRVCWHCIKYRVIDVFYFIHITLYFEFIIVLFHDYYYNHDKYGVPDDFCLTPTFCQIVSRDFVLRNRQLFSKIIGLEISILIENFP